MTESSRSPPQSKGIKRTQWTERQTETDTSANQRSTFTQGLLENKKPSLNSPKALGNSFSPSIHADYNAFSKTRSQVLINRGRLGTRLRLQISKLLKVLDERSSSESGCQPIGLGWTSIGLDTMRTRFKGEERVQRRGVDGERLHASE